MPNSSNIYRYQLIDVFTDKPFTGNPLAVFTDARGLSDKIMQKLARELNRSETTFVFPSDKEEYDYAVRIFTPYAELPTAGHPSLGTAFALAQEKRLSSQERVVFEEGGGPVSVSIVSPMMTTKQSLPVFGHNYSEPSAAAAMLSLDASELMPDVPLQAVSSGVPFLMIPILRAEALERVQLRTDIWSRTVRHFEAPNIFAFTLDTQGRHSTAKARMFAPGLGLPEDPATEAACGPLAAFLVRYGLVNKNERQFLIEQGAEVGRPSLIFVMVEHEGGELTSLRIGGQCVWVGEGSVYVTAE